MQVFENIEKPSSAISQEAKALKGKTYKCKNCGNFLSFEPDSNNLKCHHCSSEYPLAQVGQAMEIAYTSMSEVGYDGWEEDSAISCRSCGAVITLSDHQTALVCPFCGAPNIASVDSFKGLKPNGILPFLVGKNKAHTIYNKWIKSKAFSPNKLKKLAYMQDTQGYYVPMWTFDSNTHTAYTIRYGVNYTVTIGSGKNARTETRTRWYVDSGKINYAFDDIQVEASKFLTPKQVEKMGGFDTNNSKSYHNQYIAGYNSERYSKGLDESWEEVKKIADKRIVSMIKSKYHADKIDYCRTNTEYHNTTYKYTLVPIWLINYNYQNKQYGCVINGRSGKIVGKAPISPIKVGITSFVAVGILIAFIVWLMNYL